MLAKITATAPNLQGLAPWVFIAILGIIQAGRFRYSTPVPSNSHRKTHVPRNPEITPYIKWSEKICRRFLMPDGVFIQAEEKPQLEIFPGLPTNKNLLKFITTPAPTNDEVEMLVGRIHDRILKYFKRQGFFKDTDFFRILMVSRLPIVQNRNFHVHATCRFINQPLLVL